MSQAFTTTVERPADAPTYAPRVSATRAAWLPWSNSGPIATATQERAFVAELMQRSGGPAAEHTRSDITAVLNALRGGLTLDELLANAPGLQLGRLHSAYMDLEERRRQAVDAWMAIVEDPTMATLEHYGEQAARLVPVMVHRLLETADIDRGLLPRVAAYLAQGVDEVRTMIRNTELELDRRIGTDDEMELSRALYDPTTDSMFDRVEHLPERVGSLVPTRVAALLNEHIQSASLLAAS